MHWFLLEFNIEEKKIKIFDSMKKTPATYLPILQVRFVTIYLFVLIASRNI